MERPLRFLLYVCALVICNTSSFAQDHCTATTYTLATRASTIASGTVTGAGIYTAGTSVTFTAIPAPGYTFAGWSGDASGASNPITVTLDANKSVMANFLNGSNAATTTIKPVNISNLTTIRIEDDATTRGLCSFDGSVADNSGASNGRVVNLSNSTGKGIEWRITVPQAGTYTLYWRYVNGNAGNTFTMALLINNLTATSTQPFPRTASNTTFAYASATVSLAAGLNTIRLQSTTASATADIDWMEVTGNAPEAAGCSATASALVAAGSIEVSEEFTGQPFASVYPNPSRHAATLAITLQRNEQASVILYDAQGHTVDQLPVPASTFGGTQYIPYSIENKKSGLYHFLIVSSNGRRSTARLAIE